MRMAIVLLINPFVQKCAIAVVVFLGSLLLYLIQCKPQPIELAYSGTYDVHLAMLL